MGTRVRQDSPRLGHMMSCTRSYGRSIHGRAISIIAFDVVGIRLFSCCAWCLATIFDGRRRRDDVSAATAMFRRRGVQKREKQKLLPSMVKESTAWPKLGCDERQRTLGTHHPGQGSGGEPARRLSAGATGRSQASQGEVVLRVLVLIVGLGSLRLCLENVLIGCTSHSLD